MISDRAAKWAAKLPGDGSLTPERREVIDALLRRSARADLADQREARRTQLDAAAGIDRVRKAHQLVMQNADRLRSKDMQRALRQASAGEALTPRPKPVIGTTRSLWPSIHAGAPPQLGLRVWLS